MVHGRNVEIGRQHFGDGVAKLHFFALFAEIRGRYLDGVLFGFARFFGLGTFLRSKANFG